MSKEISIKSIELEIGKQILKLTVEEAEQLCDALNGLLKREKTVTQWYPYQPYWHGTYSNGRSNAIPCNGNGIQWTLTNTSGEISTGVL